MESFWNFNVSRDTNSFCLNISQKGGDHPFRLHLSCATSQELIEVLKSCSSSIDVDAVDAKGKSALYVVCEKGYHDIAEILLDMGASINFQRPERWSTRDGYTALHIATRKGMLDVVKLLLSRGAEVDICESSFTPLHLACIHKHDHIAAELVDHGADVDKRSIGLGLTSLQLASEKGSLSTVELLLRRNADVNAATEDGMTALHCSSSEVVEILLRNGANPMARDAVGSTPLHSAASRNQVEKVRLLLKCGISVNDKAYDGRTPLHRACNGTSLDAAEYLLKMGACISDVTVGCDEYEDQRMFFQPPGRTPLHFLTPFRGASEGNLGDFIKLLKLILEWGADVNARDESGETAVVSICNWTQYLAIGSQSAIAEVLIKQLLTMQAQGLHVSEVNLQAVSDHTITRKLRQSCETELENMRRQKIGDSTVTFFDLLTKGPLRLSDYAANEDIVRVFQCGQLERDFPMFASDIRLKFDRGCERHRLQRQSDSVLRQGRFRCVPYNAMRSLNRFLRNEDLTQIIKAKAY